MISKSFLKHASDILAETKNGLTWTQIVRYFVEKSVEYEVDIPYSEEQFPMETLQNKRTGFLHNLESFNPNQQFEILKELCEFNDQIPRSDDLKTLLIERYSSLSSASPIKSNLKSVQESKGILNGYPKAEILFNQAMEKIEKGKNLRNALDDLRLCLEMFLKEKLNNGKTLENQQPILGRFLKDQGASPHISNLFGQVLSFYGKYQNENIKHNDNVNSKEVSFILELTTTLINQIAKY